MPMHVGDQAVPLTHKALQFRARHGCYHIDSDLGGRDAALELDEQGYREAIAMCASEGVTLEMTHISIPESITLALPERDADIEKVIKCIVAAGKAGLRGINYNFCVLPHQSTESTKGRGGVSYRTFKLEEYDNETLSKAGKVSRDEVFARAKYFLERVIPVAEEYKIQMACHLDDPPAPTLKGVDRWDWPVYDGLKRFSELVDSPYHGFNLCCGTASEGLENPGVELYPIVAYFGERKKIFNIHFRNITGGLHDFQEVWPDEGDVNMFKLAQTLHSVGYEYMLMPDHAPNHPDEPNAHEGAPFAFQFGYIIAVVQAVTLAQRALETNTNPAENGWEGVEGWDAVRDNFRAGVQSRL